MTTQYTHVEKFVGWSRAFDFYSELQKQHNCRKILEIGAGANPLFPIDYTQQNQIEYLINDTCPDEIDKIKDSTGFDVLICNLSDPIDSAELQTNSFDMIFSRMVNEHVPDGRRYYENIFKLLKPGGITVHSFSTLYTIPFIANRILPESVTDYCLSLFAPRDNHQHGKFKTHYSWCRGPTRPMKKKFESVGYEILEYTGYFGHYYYRKRFPFLHRMEFLKANMLCRHPFPILCSYAHVVLKKPE